ncbi:hypothetical protein [Hahella ganghwensis]|uniref:hypothetical protein n=1 Tax=Hahella ganghwensis TaxID=286420 RepID=UPI00036A3220|nr:hypothetical protein [Hahella ganghwensis]
MNKIDTVMVKQRFCGPPGSGNGGYVSGLLARYCGDSAEVRLAAPPPLDRMLDVWKDNEGRVHLMEGEQVIASASPARLELDIPDILTVEEAREASTHFTGYRYHPFPQCFVCGPERNAGDGLRIFPGRGARPEVVAATWIPDASLIDDKGEIPSEMLWAALDCTGAFALNFGPDKVLVLGSFTGDIQRHPQVGEECVVMGWNLGVDGRKNYAGTAVFNAHGELCGAARAVWIELKS